MSAAPIPSQSSSIETILARVNEIAVLPHVVYKVLELSGSSEFSASEMERAIVVDPGFSSRILALANSAYMALPKKVTSIKDAIVFCGYKNVRELAMTVGVYDMFVGKSDKESLRRRDWWRHSVDTAVSAKFLAGKMGSSVDEAYTCGLLHVIGKTLLDRFGGQDYEQVQHLMAADFSDIEAEHEVYGVNHVELGVTAARKWGFPELLVEGIAYTWPPEPDSPFARHRALVAFASKIAKFVVDGKSGQARQLDVPDWVTQALHLDDGLTQDLVEGSVAAISRAGAIH